MMKYCSFIVLILLLNCNTKKVVDNSKQNTVIKLGDEVIHFDIIDYYRIKKSYADVDERNFSEKDEMKEVIFGNIPFKNTDTLFVNKLDDKYFQKVKMDSFDYYKIAEIYECGSAKFDVACKQTYRDILIFKKNNKNVGISNICFSCGWETTFFNEHFYSNLISLYDFNELENTLKRKK